MARLQGLGLNIATPNIAGIFERGGLQYATSTDSIKGDRCTRGTLGVENSRAPLPEDFARRGVVIIILLEACALDVATVGATTPAGAPLSQANLISWSLPCFNLTLTITGLSFRVDHYPAEDEKLRASSILRRRGGNCPNTLEILQQLLDYDDVAAPIHLALLSVLPSSSSPAYQEIKSSFQPSTDLSNCICREEISEPASSYIIRSQQADSRTIINYNGLPEMTVQEFVSVATRLGDMLGWCHFEGRIPAVILSCTQHLRKHDPALKISVEVEKPAREGLQDLAALADVVFFSKSWAQVDFIDLRFV
ncbi:MAG: hypothetical protein LQ337_002636 [Flavoplaca oasis]|nr:MAG: hypothetical protein LQ337_002636 [Flavoplaca oasis]